MAGAGMVPVITMNSFFNAAHFVSPLYYGVAADFNVMYGGTGTNKIWFNSMVMMFVLIVINLIIVALRKRQPMLQFNQLS